MDTIHVTKISFKSDYNRLKLKKNMSVFFMETNKAEKIVDCLIEKKSDIVLLKIKFSINFFKV